MWICHGCDLMHPDHVTTCPRCGRTHVDRTPAAADASEYQPFPSPPPGLDALSPHAIGGVRGEPSPTSGSPLARGADPARGAAVMAPFIETDAVPEMPIPAYVPDPGRAGLDSLAQGKAVRYRRVEPLPHPPMPLTFAAPPAPEMPHGEGTPWKHVDPPGAPRQAPPAFVPAPQGLGLADMPVGYTPPVDSAPFDVGELSRVPEVPAPRPSALRSVAGLLLALALLGLAAWLAFRLGLL